MAPKMGCTQCTRVGLHTEVSVSKVTHSVTVTLSMHLLANVKLTFTFAICYRPSVTPSVSVVCLSSVTFVRPTQAIEYFGNVSTPFGTYAICDLSIKILQRSSQENPFVGGGS